VAELFFVVAAAVPAAGLFNRGIIRGAFVGLSFATYPIGVVVSHVVLALVYFLVLTPVGLTMRLFGHDPLRRGFDKDLDTYWQPRDEQRTTESYFKQD
jgi:hypothetical protein